MDSGYLSDVATSNRPILSVTHVTTVAQIVPIRAEQWTTWERVRAVFDSPTDPEWDDESREFGALGIDDPWAR